MSSLTNWSKNVGNQVGGAAGARSGGHRGDRPAKLLPAEPGPVQCRIVQGSSTEVLNPHKPPLQTAP